MAATQSFDHDKTRRLRFAVILTAIVFAGELVGGIWTGSLALLSDAGHVFSDVFSLVLSLLAVRLACRPATSRHSYGYHRAEVFAALINGLSLLVICGLILREAYARLFDPPTVRPLEMLCIALVGLVANWIVAARLGGHGHGDLNLRSAYLHVLGDLLASVGVVLGAGVIAITGQGIVDPIVSMGIGALILVAAVRVTLEATHILLEGVPPGISLEAVAQALSDVPEVLSVHHLHAWSICSNVTAFSAHVVTCPENEAQRFATRARLEEVLAGQFGFSDTTLEFECDPCGRDDLLCQVEHGLLTTDSHHHHSHDGETECCDHQPE